jgi:glycosyltransferase involved in cell wall biosynthesis
MRVLYVNPFSQEVSGPDESLRTLLGALIPLGVEAHVVIPGPGPQVPRYQALGITVHFAPIAVIRRGLPKPVAAAFPLAIARGAARVAQIARRIRPDLIHSNMEVMLDGAIAARLLRLPHVMHYRGNTLDRPKWVFDPLVAIWTSLADHIFCISQATASVFERRDKAQKVEVMYNPVDIEAFAATPRSDAVRASLGAGLGQPLVGTVGRIHPRKDLETFVRAAALIAAQVPEARFTIVGSAKVEVEHQYQKQIEGLVRELNLGSRLTFAGARRDIAAVMRALDVFVNSSHHEGFGRVIAEAMAAACPVVVGDEGAPPELVDSDRYGLVARPSDPQDFAAQVLRLLRSPAEAAKFGARALERAQLFDARIVAARVYDRYGQLAARRGSRTD